MEYIDSRNDFNNTWLLEMPSGLGNFDTYEQLVYVIKDRIKSGSKVINLQNNLNKIQGNQLLYYWYEIDNEIILGIELVIKSQGLVVDLVGKNSKYKGKPPFASDLYNIIIKDHHQPIRILSDKQLSDEGYAIWKKLFTLGHTISIYDRQNPGQTFQTLHSINDMNTYFKHDDTNFERYQYVLSETGEMLAETRGFFNIRRYRELCGLSLT